MPQSINGHPVKDVHFDRNRGITFLDVSAAAAVSFGSSWPSSKNSDSSAASAPRGYFSVTEGATGAVPVVLASLVVCSGVSDASLRSHYARKQ
jgi:hypothetical protein